MSSQGFFVRLALMQIQFWGQSCFRLKGKEIALATDPFGPSLGLKLPRLSADIVTVSHRHDDHNFVQVVVGEQRKEPFVIKAPGEYEVGGVFILGIPSRHGGGGGKNTIFVIKMDGLSLVHLGDLGKKLSDEQLEEINGADIVFVPIGGTYTLDPQEAVSVINKIEPKVVIPMHYQLPGLKVDLKPVEAFLKEIGQEDVKPEPRLVISKESLPVETTVVVLKKK